MRAYHDAIRRAMLEEWDPIGVANVTSAQDEYDAYVSSVYKLLISHLTKSAIFDYLWWLETVHMGLAGDRQATERFAERLLQLASRFEGGANSLGHADADDKDPN